jgi:hypothetical protein
MRLHSVFELGATTRPDEWNDICAPRQHPGNRDLSRSCILASGDLSQHLNQLLILLEVFSGETRQVGAEITGTGRARAADQPTGEHAVGSHARAPLARGGQDFRLDAAGHDRVLDLRSGQWVRGMER